MPETDHDGSVVTGLLEALKSARFTQGIHELSRTAVSDSNPDNEQAIRVPECGQRGAPRNSKAIK